MDEQTEALIKAIGIVGGLIVAALGFAKAVISGRSKGEQLLIQREMHNQDIALDVAEGLRADMAAMRQELKESDAFHERRYNDLFRKYEECQTEHRACERRLTLLERQVRWDHVTERRTEEGT